MCCTMECMNAELRTMTRDSESDRVRGLPRVALYSHDSFGLGHVRRCMRLAMALRSSRLPVEILLLTGSSRADSFPEAAQVEMVRLPSVSKDASGRYVSGAGPRVSLDDTVKARKRVLRQALQEFRPDVLVVDHTPTGLRGELLPLLVDLRRNTGVRLILGLRDIIDDPERVVQSWRHHGIYRLLQNVYDEVWVYGSRDVFPLEKLYEMPAPVAARLSYLGYLVDPPEPHIETHMSSTFGTPDRPHVLCLVGGGGDGQSLARYFAEAMALGRDEYNATIVTGPFAPRDRRAELDALCAPLPNVQVLRFTADTGRLIEGSDAVVTMGGYNSVLEAVSRGRRTLVVPRVFPRREQWLRASAFAREGLLSMLAPEDLTAQRLKAEVDDLVSAPAPRLQSALTRHGGGLSAFSQRMTHLLQTFEKPRVQFDSHNA